MFYIVETQEQIDEIISYGNDEVFIDVIPVDDRIHPAMNTPSLVYFRPISAKRGFILCFSHLESFSLSFREVMTALIDRIPLIYTIDKKTLLHYGFKDMPVNGLKMAYMLSHEPKEFPDLSRFDTPAHKFYRNKLQKKSDVNRYIPISKHYEKYENFFAALQIDRTDIETPEFKFYNDTVNEVFYQIERSGIGINEEQFDESFNGFNKRFSIRESRIYSSYVLYNSTARPSCLFNGFNFLSLKKDDSRKTMVPQNDIFIEYDYKSYQVKLLADLLDYEFDEDDIHRHLMKVYGIDDYGDAKKLTFKYLYGRSERAPDIEFFKQVYAFRDRCWEFYQQHGYIPSPFTERRITHVTEITQILPYLMQTVETERNVMVLDKLFKTLHDYKTKLVLYSYDAFLFDYSLDDGKELLDTIKTFLQEDNYKTTMSYGESYGELIHTP